MKQSDDVIALHAAAGRQGYITGGGTAATFGADQLLKGRQLGPGTHLFRIPVGGSGAVDVTLKPAAGGVVGAPTARIYKTFADGLTIKGAAVAFAALAANTLETKSITDLRGERSVILELTVPGGGSLTLAEAEYSAA